MGASDSKIKTLWTIFTTKLGYKKKKKKKLGYKVSPTPQNTSTRAKQRLPQDLHQIGVRAGKAESGKWTCKQENFELVNRQSTESKTKNNS